MSLMPRLFFQLGSVSFSQATLLLFHQSNTQWSFQETFILLQNINSKKEKSHSKVQMSWWLWVWAQNSVQVQWTDLINAFVLLKQLETAVMTLKCTLEKNLNDLMTFSPRRYFEKPLEPETLSDVHWSHMGNFPSDANRIKIHQQWGEDGGHEGGFKYTVVCTPRQISINKSLLKGNLPKNIHTFLDKWHNLAFFFLFSDSDCQMEVQYEK